MNLTRTDLIGLAGQQMITVESLAEVDPAIFTNIKNFNYGDISVMLPLDQLYEDEGGVDSFMLA